MSPSAAESEEAKRRVLVVDDEQSIAMGILKMLHQNNLYSASHAPNGEKALEFLSNAPYDLVITDIRMPGMNGIDLLKHVRSHYPNIGVIIMTAYGSPEVQDEASRRGSLSYIEKPFDLSKLQSIIEDFFSKKNIKHDAADDPQPEESVQGIIPGLQLMDVVQMNCLSRMTCTLLIKSSGEVKQGIICFKKGNITHAETHSASGTRSGKDAFFELASWQGGSFDTIQEVPDTVTIVDSWEQLLIESMQYVSDVTEDTDAKTPKVRPKVKEEIHSEAESGDTSKMLDRIMDGAEAHAVYMITSDGFVIDKRLKEEQLDLVKSSDEIAKILPNILSVSQAINAGKLHEINFRFANSIMMIRNVEDSDLLIIVISPSSVPSGNMYKSILKESENLKKII
ncbi:response regulator receiver protein [Chloroherpeton thalassium ATCC 35110]|uniref:Response regulator receiver protein n=1 Tax=Chloroherpeton thalassium (strain ATCC 35110 / GB-78) TaxID=517418 RepID=B3QWP8_CHLT3|nr:response regulator [Chloroherpeton thalassium]ACF14808.1 response regulator receiver protein [Chloroherpeton thalassium ATCC 35110]